MRDAPAILLAGPTASGKSAVAMTLAERFPIEIVSVDSAQVYRGMDVGTAKPSPAERGRVPHHLIDIVDPTAAYSAARFRDDALRLAAEIRARARIPLFVGGTMLYFKALLDGLADLPAADPEVRADIDRDAAARGWPALHAELARLDPATAARLEPGDAQRIQRALEVHRLTGRPMSAQLARSDNAQDFPHAAFALVPPERAVLHERIAARYDAMLAAGLLDELVALRARWTLHAGLPAMRCVGYRQAWMVLEGTMPLAELRDRGIFATRQLAKRQLTWLRSMDRFQCFDALAADVVARVGAGVERALAGG
jgi:tRNA dimethylallyltransferase